MDFLSKMVYFMRVDKFLKVSRILKRRTVANEACSLGRVLVNGREVKPAFRLSIGDIVEIKYATGTIKFKVKDLKEHVRKEDIDTLYEIIN